jgi:hypothetical protein
VSGDLWLDVRIKKKGAAFREEGSARSEDVSFYSTGTASSS